MAYSYLLDLYRALAEREQAIKQQQNNGPLEPEIENFLQGRLDTVNDFSSFLRNRFHAKLPRRLQKNL